MCSEGFGQQIMVLLAPGGRTKAAFCSGISLLSRKPNSVLGVEERATVRRKWFDTSELLAPELFHISLQLRSVEVGGGFNRFVHALSPKSVAGQVLERDYGCGIEV